jgi:large subunit ribosomal protein L14e
MASIEIEATTWRRVEVGRVLKLENGGLATIVEIVDHKRVCGNRPTPRRRSRSGCK